MSIPREETVESFQVCETTTRSNNNYRAAARALHDADYLLVLAGAGMSADSGLSTYENMPEKYRDLCDPSKLAGSLQERAEFFGFWYDFAVAYANTTPHEGYSILDRWCHGKKLQRLSTKPRTRKEEDGAGTSGSLLADTHKWWVYTSNVDGHFSRFPSFDRDNNNNNVCEIHGFAGLFRCSCGIGHFGEPQTPRMGDLWTRWNHETSQHITDRCRSSTESLEDLQKRTNSQRTTTTDNDNNNTSFLCCKECHRLCLRPNVLLFNDTDEHVLVGIRTERARYQDWEASVEDRVAHDHKNLVLVELGCGLKVPAIRRESQEVLRDANELSSKYSGSGGGSVSLIRINPRDAGIDGELDEQTKSRVLSIYETSLVALQEIDRELDALLSHETNKGDG